MTPCEHIESVSTQISPLHRMLVTGYYDGPTDGIVECRECGQTYSFRKIAWDEEQDVRIFGLAPLVERFDQIRRELLRLGESDDAVQLVPPTDDSSRSALDRLAASPLRYVVASLDLREGFLAKRPLAAGEVVDRNWFEWLGL